jgi:hypothetical protein
VPIGNALNVSSANSVIITNSSGIPIASTSLPSSTTLNGSTINVVASGTFDPTIAFGGTSVGVNYAVQNGFYTQMTGSYLFSFYILLNSKGSSVGLVSIENLPFLSRAIGLGLILNPVLISDGNSLPNSVLGFCVENSMSMSLGGQGGSNINYLDNTNFTDTSEIFCSGMILI